MKFNKVTLEAIKADLIESIKLTGTRINPEQICILDCGCPHEITTLPKGKMAVYSFFHGNECLKIGKAGPNSNARFNSQHYNPNNSKSNLANSILTNKFPVKTTSNEIGNWIKNNTQRINFLLDDKLGIFVLNFVEAFLHLKFKPKFEGSKNQNN